MQPLNYYLSLLARRLPLLIVGVVVGAALGWITTPDSTDSEDQGTASYFRATHTLVSGQPRDAVNLDQLAFLTVVGDVPRAAGQQLQAEPSDLVSSVQIRVLPAIQAIQLTAYASDAAHAVEIADSFANGLLDQLRDQRDEQLSELSAKADELRRELAELPVDPSTQLQRQRALDDLDIVNDQLRSVTAQTVSLTTADAAVAVPISRAAYASALNQIQVNGPVQSLAGSESSGLSFPVPSTSSLDTVADTSEDPSAAVRALLGAIVGLIATSAVVIALDRLDPRIRTAEDAEDALGVPVLAQVPAYDRTERRDQPVVRLHPHSRAAESFRTLRTAALNVRPSNDSATSETAVKGASDGVRDGNGTRPGGTVVLITSPEPGVGKTNCAANLAAAVAETGKRVLVIDSDFRDPGIDSLLRPSSSITLADALWPVRHNGARESAVPLDFSAVVSPTQLLGVSLLRAADRQSIVVSPSRLLLAVLSATEWAAGKYDVVIVDSAALLSVNDASELLPTADVVVVVVRAGSTTSDVAAQASELLHRLGARAVGTVLTEASLTAPTRRSDFARTATSSNATTGSQRTAAKL